MHVEESGSGHSTVLIHGNAPPASLAPLAEALAERFRTHLVSLPGFDPSSETHPGSAEGIRDRLVDYLNELDDPVLIGHSVGAYRAFDVALHAPDRVAAIVALSPVASLADEEREMFRDFAAGLRAGADLTAPAVEQWFSADFVREHPEVRDQVRRWLDGDRLALAADIEATAEAPDLQDRLPEVSCPVYVRTGEFDLPIPPARARVIAERIPHASYDSAQGAGHMLAFEDLEGTARATREHITRFVRSSR